MAIAFREVCEVLYSKEKYQSAFLREMIQEMDGFQLTPVIGNINPFEYWKKAFALRRYLEACLKERRECV